MNRRNLFPIFFGALLLTCGVVSLIVNLVPEAEHYINLNLFWPIFVLLPGLAFWGMYLGSRNKKKDKSLLIPGNIFTFVGLILFTNVLVTELLDYSTIWTWTIFLYPGSVALAFWIAWAVGEDRNPALIIPAVILTFISLITLCSTLALVVFTDLAIGRVFGPLIIIAAGLLVMLSPFWGKSVKSTKFKEQFTEGEILEDSNLRS